MKEKELIEEYKLNDSLDIEKIYYNYYGYVNTIIINMSKSYLKDEDIEEIVADTFLILWKNTKRLEDNRQIKPYIAGITKNLVKEKIRKNKVNLDISDYENKLESKENIDFIIEEREKISIIEDEIEKLKKDEQEIFKLYYYQFRKIKEIAILMNISEFSVKQKLYRIRKKLKKKGGYRNEK